MRPLQTAGPTAARPGHSRNPWGHTLQADSQPQDTRAFLLAGLLLCTCLCVLWLAKPLFVNWVREEQESRQRGIRGSRPAPPLLVFPCEKAVRRNRKSLAGLGSHGDPARVQLSSLFTVFVALIKSHTLFKLHFFFRFLREDNTKLLSKLKPIYKEFRVKSLKISISLISFSSHAPVFPMSGSIMELSTWDITHITIASSWVIRSKLFLFRVMGFPDLPNRGDNGSYTMDWLLEPSPHPLAHCYLPGKLGSQILEFPAPSTVRGCA